ncbi:MAG TPA: C1 family peptidase [Polyangiaceae bacterium]
MLRMVPEILDQGDIGSCVANAALGAVRLKQKVQSGERMPELGSRLLTYYLCRGYIGTEESDSGCHIRDAFRGFNQYGFCRESAYPYRTSRFAQKPPAHLFTRAFDQRDPARYWRISSHGEQRIAELKAAIDAGNPIVCGAMIGQAFLDWDGTIGMKCPMSVGAAAGHAFFVAGYHEHGVVCVNSWGRDWGDLGRFCVAWDSPELGDADKLLDVWVVERAPQFSDEPRSAA